MTGTILPSLPPLADDYVVSVCAACKLRSCLLERKRCASRKNGDAGELQLTVAELRASGSQEHHGYWRAQPGEDSDMPRSIDELVDLAEHMKRPRADDPDFAAVGMDRAVTFAGYITEELGLDQAQCRDVLKDVWPEASAAIAKWMEP